MKTYYLLRRDEEISGPYHADYQLYGVKYDGSREYIKVEYNRRVQPEFTTVVIGPDDSRMDYYVHPRKCGVTKSDNWSVNPELLSKDWKVR